MSERSSVRTWWSILAVWIVVAAVLRPFAPAVRATAGKKAPITHMMTSSIGRSIDSASAPRSPLGAMS